MRVFLLLPDHDTLKNEDLQKYMAGARKKWNTAAWITRADIEAQIETETESETETSVDQRAEAFAKRLQQEDCAQAYVLEDYPRSLEELTALDVHLKAISEKAPLPDALYWCGPAKKDQRDAVKTFRKQVFPLSEYMYENRRMIAVQKIKKLNAGFKEAIQRSKKIQILRRGMIGACVGTVVVSLIALLFFRDPLMKCMLVDYAEDSLQARFDIGTFSTSLLDCGLQMDAVAAADVKNPMRNIVEWESLRTSWDIDALLGGDLHARELAIQGVRFDTERTESGALPVLEKEPVVAVKEENVDESSAFVDAMNNTLGNFVPPTVESLASHKVLTEMQTLATTRRQNIIEQSQKIDIAARLKESQAAAAVMKKGAVAGIDASDGEAVRADLDANADKLHTLQASTSADFTKLEKTLEKMKSCKVSGVADIAEAKTIIEDAKSVSDTAAAIKKNVAAMKEVVAASRERIATEGKEISARAVKAKKDLTETMAAVRAPLDTARADVAALAQSSSDSIAELRAGKVKMQAALETDIRGVKKQYGVEGLKAGVDQLLSELIGDALYDKLTAGYGYYQAVKPWLPVTEKTAKSKRETANGSIFDFSLPVEEGDVSNRSAALWIERAVLSGVFQMSGEAMDFTATVNDFTSNMSYTQKPVTCNVSAKSTDGISAVSADLQCQGNAELSGHVEISGLSIEQQKLASGGGASAALAPSDISCAQLQIKISDIHMADGVQDALIELHMSGVQLTAASGVGSNPELAAVFSETYAQIKELKVYLGVGSKKTLRTEPDISKMLTAGLRKKVEVRLQDARSKAEADIRAKGLAQGADIDALIAGFTPMKEVDEKNKELTDASSQVAVIEGAEHKRLDEDALVAQKSLSVYDADLKQQENAAASQEAKMNEVLADIEIEKKRLEKKMLGGGLKGLFKKF